MRQIALTTVKGGINRLRTKGAARADSLYDLVNGYVTAARTVKARPGTIREATLPSDTKGLVAFDGGFHVFSHAVVEVPDGFTLHVLSHPDSDEEEVVALTDIHFAEPFMGFLYVVAEFDDTDYSEPQIFHFWLQTGATWEANKIYRAGDIVVPSTPNGFVYQATRLDSPLPSWAPGVKRTLGDKIEPTEYNDFTYEVVDVLGDNPISGNVEPDWPEEDGAQVFEDTDGSDSSISPTTPTTQPPSTQQPPSIVRSRYNRGDTR